MAAIHSLPPGWTRLTIQFTWHHLSRICSLLGNGRLELQIALRRLAWLILTRLQLALLLFIRWHSAQKIANHSAALDFSYNSLGWIRLGSVFCRLRSAAVANHSAAPSSECNSLGGALLSLSTIRLTRWPRAVDGVLFLCKC